MDTKRNKSEKFKKEAALKAKTIIDRWRPDVVIASDDNVSKYLIAPYYKGKELPFVFCGLNWDASVYGFPAKNVTGMVEVTLVRQALKTLKKYAKGNRIGFISSDTLTNRKTIANYKKIFGLEFDAVALAKTYDDGETSFVDIQKQVDMLFVINIAGINDWFKDKAIRYVNENTTVPTGCFDTWMTPYCLIGLVKTGREQGEWTAQTALKIIDGKKPSQIPVVKNKKAMIYLNMPIANKMGIKFPIELIENANLIEGRKKKVLFVNSYHKGYRWSDDIEKGLKKALGTSKTQDGSYDASKSLVTLKIIRMDTKLNKSEKFIKRAALDAKKFIEEWKPDLVIACDDNASKYLIEPYYKNRSLPIIFCGLNWGASEYGFPSSNITGMIEVAPVLETIEMLTPYANGDRIGYIGVNALSARKNLDYYKNYMGINFTRGRLVDTFEQWKSEYLKLQGEVDMIIWLNPVGIKGWDPDAAIAYIYDHTRVPTGAVSESEARFALAGTVNIPEEQGWWAGNTALRILDGTSPAEISVTTNQQTRAYINIALAKKMGIIFPMDVLEDAIFIGDQ